MIGFEQFNVGASGSAGQNVNTAQPWFPQLGGITLLPIAYFFDGLL